jgi:hypothetical protein
MSPSRPPANPLQHRLDEAESELSRRLREACEAEARGAASGSAEEIRRLEDTLLAAVAAAQRTLAAHHRLKDAPEAEAHDDVADPGSTRPDSTVREFEDETGRSWRAWPVIPDAARSHQVSQRSLGEFQEGWICFEALDNSGRRRLPGQARLWSDLAPEELPRLLERAIAVPPRKSRSAGASDDPSSADAG